MAITILPTPVIVDETSGPQNDGTSGDATGNEVLLGSGTDLPDAFSLALTSLPIAGTPDAATLSGFSSAFPLGVNVVDFGGADVSGVSFVDASGDPFSGFDSGLKTTDETPVFLYTLESDDNVLVGVKGAVDPLDPAAVIVFAAYLEENATGAKVWLLQFETLFHTDDADHDDPVSPANVIYIGVDELTPFSLAGAPSGQNLFLMFGTPGDGDPGNGDEVAIVVTAKNPLAGNSVNTGQGGGTTTIGSNNQMLDPGEGLVFTFVTNANSNYTVPNLDQNEADVAANIQFGGVFDAPKASFRVVQTQPASKSSTLTISAFTTETETGAAYVDPLNGFGDDDHVDIVSVVVRNAAGVIIESEGPGTDNVNGAAPLDIQFIVVNPGPDQYITAKVIGVKAGYTIEYTTDGNHNRVQIDNTGVSNTSTGADFDIGDFSLPGTTTTPLLFDSLVFEDDGPTVIGTVQTGEVDEDGLPGGNPEGTGDLDADDGINDDADGDETTFSGNIAAIFDPGADGLGSYGLSTDAAHIALLPTLTSQGGTVDYDVTGNTLTAYVDDGDSVLDGDDRPVFTLVLDPTNGDYTFTLLDQLDHPIADTEDDLTLNLGAILQVFDVEGDSATADADMLVITVDDDSPVEFTPNSITLTNTGSDSGSEALNDAASVGADEPGTTVFVDNFIGDDYLRDGNGDFLTVGGDKIVLTGFGGNMLTATTETGLATVFTATIGDPTTNEYTITFSMAVDDVGGVNFLGAAPVKSGNPTYNVINNVDGTTLDLLFSGGDVKGGSPATHSVNVSTQGAGTDNQSMNAGETLRIDFAEGASLAGSPLGKDFVLGTHETVNGFAVLLSQNTPSGTTGTMFIQAFDADSDKDLVGDPGDVVDALDMVTVNGVILVENGALKGSGSTTVNGMTVQAILHMDGVVLTGLNEGQTGDGSGGDDPIIKVFTADGFNRVEISNYAGQIVGGNTLGGTSFDIAPAGVDVAGPGDGFDFELAVQQTDYDGDTGPIALIGVVVDPV